jgi:hypothetical protein
MPTKRKNIFKREKVLMDYFYYVMKNKNDCRQLCLKFLNKIFKTEFKEEFLEIGEIGFYIKSETADGCFYTFSCEHVGSSAKMVLVKKKTPNEYIAGNYVFTDIHIKFSIKSIYKILSGLKI